MARNNLLTEELNYIGGSKTPTHLHLCVYTPAGVESHDGDTLDDVLPYFKEGAMHWMQIHGLRDTEEVQKVCQHFHITIFIPLTFLAGIWGVNFRVMPELDWKYGYVYAWALMLLIAIGICVYFRRKKWY